MGFWYDDSDSINEPYLDLKATDEALEISTFFDGRNPQRDSLSWRDASDLHAWLGEMLRERHDI